MKDISKKYYWNTSVQYEWIEISYIMPPTNLLPK